jgi:DNA polymerase III delta prime subunit
MTTITNMINKYKPSNVSDFKLDKSTSMLIASLLEIDDLNILLCGTIGAGKTSLLNAIITDYYKGYSYKIYNENILQINNLKEQGINYYRSEVKTFCQTSSVIPNKKKIIVLDDIDFINEQNQQVFRNCIDKYKHKVHFISSCNNIQKVIDSIQSRFTMIRLKPLEIHDIRDIIHRIKKQECLVIDDATEDFILTISNGSVNVVINYLEKFKLINKPIDIKTAHSLCSNIGFIVFEEYTQLVITNKLVLALRLLYNIYEQGYSVIDILDNYFLFVKLTDNLSDEQKYNIIPCICKYITIFNELHEDEIELSMFTNNLIYILNC